MQKMKRKIGEGDTPSPKKKKVQFTEGAKDNKSKTAEKNIKKPKNAEAKQNSDSFKKDFQIASKKDFKNSPKKDFKSGPKKDFKGPKKDFKKGKPGDKFNKFGKVKGNFGKGANNKFVKDQNSGEKPKWSEMKKEKKQLRLVRRKAKTSAEVFEIANKAKLLAAQIQRKVVKPDFRLSTCKELHTLLKGQYKAIALTHDLSRVIQVLLKHSAEDIRNEITEELLDLMVPMVQSKYGHHAVKRILKYGSDSIRHKVINKFFGHIVSLATHTVSAPVLDYAYGEFASKKEKEHMQQEFYGDIYKNTKDNKVHTLSDTYKDSPEMKTAILQSCQANIQKILNKNLHDGELLHSVLYDYIRECSDEERTELLTTLAPLIVPLSNSLPGANAASICVWQGSNKDKKTILKVVKEHAVALAKHKTGYRLLLAIFDAVDDTVLVRKAIVSALQPHVRDLARDHWGNMTLHWLVKPKDPGAFHPSLIKFLEEGFRSGTSKKDSAIRVAELREAILPALVKDIGSDPEFWVSEKTIMLLAVAVLSIESAEDMVSALAGAVCRPDWAAGGARAVEDAGLHMCLKKLAALDQTRDGGTLGEAVCDRLTEDTIRVWLPTNRGCFFLLKLIESNRPEVASRIKKTLKPHVELLKKQNTEGAKLLLQNVQSK
ncbi:protein penguin [Cydia pomonella]|uniref:protein penguin n=1 Tax=Cydia pomonella TaxID=82600 RepID=UPI002ADD6EFE|nr:protein penguin [Cydia pomonella]XP_061713690.1 protein penguin [Cydia pomonella]